MSRLVVYKYCLHDDLVQSPSAGSGKRQACTNKVRVSSAKGLLSIRVLLVKAVPTPGICAEDTTQYNPLCLCSDLQASQ